MLIRTGVLADLGWFIGVFVYIIGVRVMPYSLPAAVLHHVPAAHQRGRYLTKIKIRSGKKRKTQKKGKPFRSVEEMVPARIERNLRKILFQIIFFWKKSCKPRQGIENPSVKELYRVVSAFPEVFIGFPQLELIFDQLCVNVDRKKAFRNIVWNKKNNANNWKMNISLVSLCFCWVILF